MRQISPKIADRIEAIKKDKTHGATWLSEEAISILIQAVRESKAQDTRRFIKELKEITKALAHARPGMVSITNYAFWFSWEVIAHSRKEADLSSLKTLAEAKGGEIIRLARQAVLNVVRNGANIIHALDTIMTCSYSATVCQCFETAKSDGKKFRVIIAESKSPDGMLYSELMAERLRQSGFPIKIVRDDEVANYMPEVTKVLVGADSILRDGSLINGAPTHTLASAASAFHIPFYSLCQTAKFDPYRYEGKNLELEAGFDNVPAKFITGIVTEFGTIRPDHVWQYSKEIKRRKVLLKLNPISLPQVPHILIT